MDAGDSMRVDVQEYVRDLVTGRLGVEAFCAAMRMTHEEQAAVQALRDRSEGNTQVVSALRRLGAGSHGHPAA